MKLLCTEFFKYFGSFFLNFLIKLMEMEKIRKITSGKFAILFSSVPVQARLSINRSKHSLEYISQWSN